MWSKILLNRSTMFYIGIAILAGVIWFKFYGLQKEIKNLENVITKKELIITEQMLEIEKRKNNELVLKTQIDRTNELLETMRVDTEKLKSEIEVWKNKKPEKIVQVVNKLVPDRKITVENCYKIMSNLKTLKYDEL